MNFPAGRCLSFRQDAKDVLVSTSIFLTALTFHYLNTDCFRVSIQYFVWQLLPVSVLREHAWQSLLFLHAQPPFLNGLLALLLHLEAWTTIEINSWALGTMLLTAWVTCVTWYGIARRLLGSSLWAILLIFLLAFNPGFDTYLKTFSYTSIVQAELGVWVLALWLYARKGTRRRLMLVMALLALMIYTRATWHPLFGMVLLMLIGWQQWLSSGDMHRAIRRTLLGFVMFALLVGPWMLKNVVLFGQAGFTTWLGLNLMPRDGSIRPVAIYDFAMRGTYDPDVIKGYYSERQLRWLKDKPALTVFKKNILPVPPILTWVNMNHLAVPPLNCISMRQVVQTYWAHPIKYLRHITQNAFNSSLPADYLLYSQDRQNMSYKLNYAAQGYARWHDRVYYGGWLIPLTQIQIWGISIGFNFYMLFWLPFALLGGMLRWRRIGQTDRFVWTVLWLIQIWFWLVLVLIDGVEGARYRWEIEPVFLLLVLQNIREICGNLRNRQGHRFRQTAAIGDGRVQRENATCAA